MSSCQEPKILTFLADGVIAKGKAVKIGSDRKHVAVCSAETDKVIGIAQGASTAAEDEIEIAMPGGGGKALIAETVAAGDLLVAQAGGDLGLSNAAGNQIIAQVLESAVVGDIAAVSVIRSVAIA